MATLVLAGAGAALGGSFGGSLLGLSSMALGKAAGATFGSLIDEKLLGAGAEPVETGRVDRFRVMGSSEGAGLARVFGRSRVAGQLIWSSRFLENVSSEDVGGKGGGGGATVREYSYSVSIAVALCEGEVIRVGRIWADGQPVEQSGLNWRLHKGTEDQAADPLIAAIEGGAETPAYRGTAYVVIENLELGPYGNRIPQFSFEVFRRAAPTSPTLPRPPALDVRGVALVPGTGEYALATEPVYFRHGKGGSTSLNVHNDRGEPDLLVSLDHLEAELPGSRAVSLVVSWFGDDLRCDRCTLRPKVEQTMQDGDPMRWRVSGLERSEAEAVSLKDNRPVFGGTPADASVIQAIGAMKARGHAVVFYPFLLMDILEGNGLTNPWTGAGDQPPVPWRGRITLTSAPGRPGSSDKSPAAADEVANFFGAASAADFDVSGSTVMYTGPPEWSYRRFILHYAHLCAHAGGVDAFCIGSELRGLTQIRDAVDEYPAVRALIELAAEVRSILGGATQIGYAADWSEYFGHRPDDGSGDMIYHLDPLWARPEIDFIGIDNYMPLSDWRDEAGHADASAGSIYDLDYLAGNVAGGEGYDWYYASAEGRLHQERLPITDGAYGEPWVFRFKDLVNWWSRTHVNRVGGLKATEPTQWQPKSKPIWFTELGCPAVNKGTNQPNVFYDPKSSESFFPYFSDGTRDDFIQYRYLQAMFRHWHEPKNNPTSDQYAGRMVDMDRAFVWAWDARPWPDFPNRIDTWIDGSNYDRGHWLNGRTSLSALGEIVTEVCERAGIDRIDVARLHGTVTGYTIDGVESGRKSLQPLMLAFGFDSFTVGETVGFVTRGGETATRLDANEFVVVSSGPVQSLTRSPEAEAPNRVTFGFVRSDMDYAAGAVDALGPDGSEQSTEQTSLPIVMSESSARAVAERWLHEARVARDALEISLPPSSLDLVPGDAVISGEVGEGEIYRVDRVEDLGHRSISAVRIEPVLYRAPFYVPAKPAAAVLAAPTPVYVEFLDLPLLTGNEVAHSPHVAVARQPWAGSVAVFSSPEDHGYSRNVRVNRPAVVGDTLDALPAGDPGRWMMASIRVRLASGSLQSRSELDVFNGANAAAVRHASQGDWEVLQFRNAELVSPNEYLLSGFLRGQAGTDAMIPDVWPAGSDFVLLDESVVQVNLPSSARGLARHYRIGPATQPYDHPSYRHVVEAFDGVGLRPYRPVHLSAKRLENGDIEFRWVRRSRIDGDSWQGFDIPVGEESELYHARVVSGAETLRDFAPETQVLTYRATEQAADGVSGPLVFEVAQVSERFGPGPYGRIQFND